VAKDLLIEIGCEELPAGFVNRALEAMPKLVVDALDAARLTHGEAKAYGTPRRLAIIVKDVAERTPDVEEEVLGPPKSAAFDADGAPKKAAEGFAKKFGLGIADVRLVKTDKGEYAAVTRREKGRDASAALSEIIAALPPRIPFQKSMRWGAGDVAFGRPIHWIVALLGEAIVEGSFAGIAFGRTSRGHRFLSTGAVTISGAAKYVDTLREAHVVVDEAERRARMVDALHAAAKRANGELMPDDFLVVENASLVEEPQVVLGSFEQRFLELPEEVIVAVMRGHQRYFAVKDAKTGKLLPRYLCVANTAIDPERIAKGNDRVLRARLSDARFFVEEDRKKTLESRVTKLDGIVFQAKLGSVGDKVRRVGALATSLGAPRGAEAATLAKADLVSLIVGEFPELQGLMGRWYGLAEGIDAELADAIRDHYLPKGAGDAIPEAPLAAALAIADRADTLVGCIGVGIVPTGSQDPFALRRAALGILRIALEGPLDIDLAVTLERAYAGFGDQKKSLAAWSDVGPKLDELLRARLRAFFGEANSGDLVEACLAAWDGRSVRDLDRRVRALAAFKKDPAFESLAIAFKRAWNIAKDASSGDVDEARLEAGAERDLWTSFTRIRAAMEEHTSHGDYPSALALVAAELRAPIDRYFTDVFVMVDDVTIRENRLRMLRTIAGTLNRIAHFHLLGS
jgi:glycyl-tRNA synthetase beta chain